MIKAASYIDGERTDSNNAEKTGSLNEFGSLPYFTYIKVDSK